MLINFFHGLRDAGIPVTTRELLDLLEGLKRHLVVGSVDQFYYFSRACLVKDEKYFDRFDKAFGAHFRDLEGLDDIIEAMIPDDWLRNEFMKELSEEDKAKIESLGGLEKLIEDLVQEGRAETLVPELLLFFWKNDKHEELLSLSAKLEPTLPPANDQPVLVTDLPLSFLICFAFALSSNDVAPENRIDSSSPREIAPSDSPPNIRSSASSHWRCLAPSLSRNSLPGGVRSPTLASARCHLDSCPPRRCKKLMRAPPHHTRDARSPPTRGTRDDATMRDEQLPTRRCLG